MSETIRPIPPPVHEYRPDRDGGGARVEIYDTTLRDGAQSEGISWSVEDKFKVLHALDRLGVDFVEGGWPGANPKDVEFFQRAAGTPLQHTRLVAFGSTRRAGIAADRDPGLKALVEAGTPWVAIFGKSWDFHVREALRTTLEENLAMIADSVRFLKETGRQVIYDAEHFFDGHRDAPEYAILTILAAAEAGADRIVLCDTNGGTLPAQVRSAVLVAASRLGAVPIGIHAHNDCELAVANSLAAVAAGARHVQGTINGIGERCGNANLCSVIPNLELKMGLKALPEGRLARLTPTARFVSEVANRIPNSHQPFVGRSAFTHKAGIHVSAIERTRRAYEHIEPAEVGNVTRVLVSDQMGSSNVLNRARSLGIDLSGRPETMRVLVDRIRSWSTRGTSSRMPRDRSRSWSSRRWGAGRATSRWWTTTSCWRPAGRRRRPCGCGSGATRRTPPVSASGRRTPWTRRCGPRSAGCTPRSASSTSPTSRCASSTVTTAPRPGPGCTSRPATAAPPGAPPGSTRTSSRRPSRRSSSHTNTVCSSAVPATR